MTSFNFKVVKTFLTLCSSIRHIKLCHCVQNYDKGQQTDIAILDFSKAFDTVTLLHKLQHYGINKKILSWLNTDHENDTHSRGGRNLGGGARRI